MPIALKGAAAVLILVLLAGCGSGKFQRPQARSTTDPGGQIFGAEEMWRENEVALPSYPQDENLQSFVISGPTENTFYIDTRSLNVGTDGVVRYAVVVRSKNGVDNVSYQGIRCETREWKGYAYGTAERSWSAARDPQWQRIVWLRTNAVQYALYREYLCLGGAPVNKRTALAEMRRLKTIPPGQNP